MAEEAGLAGEATSAARTNFGGNLLALKRVPKPNRFRHTQSANTAYISQCGGALSDERRVPKTVVFGTPPEAACKGVSFRCREFSETRMVSGHGRGLNCYGSGPIAHPTAVADLLRL
jgi:hypothetical protein